MTDNIFHKVREEIADLDDAEYEFEGYYKAVNDALQIIDKYAEQEPTSPCDLCRFDQMDIDGICGHCPAMAKGGE